MGFTYQILRLVDHHTLWFRGRNSELIFGQRKYELQFNTQFQQYEARQVINMKDFDKKYTLYLFVAENPHLPVIFLQITDELMKPTQKLIENINLIYLLLHLEFYMLSAVEIKKNIRQKLFIQAAALTNLLNQVHGKIMYFRI